MNIVTGVQFTMQEKEDLLFALNFTLESSEKDNRISERCKIALKRLSTEIENAVDPSEMMLHKESSSPLSSHIKKTFKARISNFLFCINGINCRTNR